MVAHVVDLKNGKFIERKNKTSWYDTVFVLAFWNDVW